MQAVILAAGMGKRMNNLTDNCPKCMIKVNGVSIIERLLVQLDKLSLDRIIIVLGYEKEKLKEAISNISLNTKIIFADNDAYEKTNNIYSLYIVRHYLKEDTLLLESDLILEDGVLTKVVDDKYPDIALVAKYESWMDGTVVTLDDEHFIKKFILKNEFSFDEADAYYKTVNVYKFSKNFLSQFYIPFLEAFCSSIGYTDYYECILRVLLYIDGIALKSCCLHNELWYEIDNKQDLDIAESIFLNAKEKSERLRKRYGGYWRYPKLIDFCYLVNPYFPNERMLSEISRMFHCLTTSYPSGQAVNSSLAASLFGVNTEQICVGNGASELIQILLQSIKGKIGIIYPTFEEYAKKHERIVAFEREDYLDCGTDKIIGFFQDKDIQNLILINPDNPSGVYYSKADIHYLIEWTYKRNIRLIVDESFVDFVDSEEEATLINKAILEKYKHLVVIKSLSKSYGLPGIRLGVLGCGDESFVKEIKSNLPIWNINSIGEFFLQVFIKYQADYKKAINKFYSVRESFYEELRKIPNIEPLPSQANFIMCEIKGGINSKYLTRTLLNDFNILIKDLSEKKGINGQQFIRISVRTKEDNEKLINALKITMGR